MKRPLKIVLSTAATLIGGAAVAYYLLPFCVSKPNITPPPSTAVYDRHGEWLGFVTGKDGYRCHPLTEVPAPLAQALVAAEDKRFYHHGGIDFPAVARALIHRLNGSSHSGASTISMQVAKLYSPPAARNWTSKIREALQARRLEMSHSKHELLLAYLNRADFSNLCRGAACAARFYFGKPASELNHPEAALLAALVKAPSRLNPLQHPQAALQRRNHILQQLDHPTPEELGASAHTISAPPITRYGGTLTIDAELQRRCTQIVREEVRRLHQHNVSQAAILIADNRSSEVLVALPAAFPDSRRGGALNGLRTPRSAGSTLKPFVYLMALGNGAWPGTILADVPTLYRSPDGIQAPGNYNDKYLGPITMRQALACSQNIPAMEALNRYGGVERQISLLRSLGFTISGDKAEYGLGLAIGNAHVTLTELVSAYSTLARNGSHLPLQFRLPLTPATAQQLLPPRDSYRIAHILSDRAARAATFGPAPALSFPYRVAAKTGTSSNYRDNWCLGFTAEYTVGVWVGNFDNSPMYHISGVSGAGPIFHRVMKELHRRQPASFPEQPEGLTAITIDTRTGTPATERTPQDCRTTELATPENLTSFPTADYDEQGRVVLDSRYAEWYKHSGMSHLYTLAATAPSDRRPAILIPAPGTTLTIDPTLPHGGRMAELRSTLPPAATTWHSDTLRTIQRNGKWYVILRPGTHTLRAVTPEHSAQSTFHVEE